MKNEYECPECGAPMEDLIDVARCRNEKCKHEESMMALDKDAAGDRKYHALADEAKV